MNAHISARFDNLEERRKTLVELVKAMPAEVQRAPLEGKYFSPAQVIEHMALSEEQSVERMRKIGPTQLKGKKANTTFIFKKVVKDMRVPRRIKPGPNMSPKADVNVESAARHWETVRSQLRSFFEQADGPNAPMQKFLFFGTMSANDLLDLYEAHQIYHETFMPRG